ncbi:hypothetical protein [Streptomyces sp. NPDC051662]|uniref:hypothetical protein n=1 Tax=Streptomyces sp. NPDC051662 TaxID=3154750 RepID=UPI00341D66BA
MSDRLSDPGTPGTPGAALPGAVRSLTPLALDHSSGRWRLAIGRAGYGLLAPLFVAPASAVLPAARCAHLLSVHARRGSAPRPARRILARPLPLTLVALFAAALSCLYLLATAVFGEKNDGARGAHGALAPTPGGALAPTVPPSTTS